MLSFYIILYIKRLDEKKNFFVLLYMNEDCYIVEKILIHFFSLVYTKKRKRRKKEKKGRVKIVFSRIIVSV